MAEISGCLEQGLREEWLGRGMREHFRKISKFCVVIMVVTTLLFALVETTKLCIKMNVSTICTFYLFIKKKQNCSGYLLDNKKHVGTKKQLNKNSKYGRKDVFLNISRLLASLQCSFYPTEISDLSPGICGYWSLF